MVVGNVSEASIRDFCSEFFHPDHFGHFNTEFSVCLMTRSLLAIQQLFDNNIAPLGKLQALAGTVLSRDDCQRAKMDASSVSIQLALSSALSAPLTMQRTKNLEKKKGSSHLCNNLDLMSVSSPF